MVFVKEVPLKLIVGKRPVNCETGWSNYKDQLTFQAFFRYLIAINDKAAGEPDTHRVATPVKGPASNSRRRGQAQAAIVPSTMSTASVRKTPPPKARRSSSLQTPTDHPVSSIKEEPKDTPLRYSDGTELAMDDIMDLDNESDNGSGNNNGESVEEESDVYELASDEEWGDEGEAITHVELPSYSPNDREAVVKVNFAVTFEAEHTGEVDHQIIGIYSDIHDANQAAQKHAREQRIKLRHKERVYGDGTFHLKATSGQREQYKVDVSRVTYIGRKKPRNKTTAAPAPQ